MTTDPKRTVCDVRGCRRWKNVKPLDSRYVGTMLRVGPRLCPQHTQDAINGSKRRHGYYDTGSNNYVIRYDTNYSFDNWNGTWSNTA